MLDGKELNIDVTELEGMFAKPESKVRVKDGAAAEDAKAKASRVSLLDTKRSTSVGIVMKRITDGLQGKELRDALLEVDENLLPLETLPMGTPRTHTTARALSDPRGPVEHAPCAPAKRAERDRPFLILSYLTPSCRQ